MIVEIDNKRYRLTLAKLKEILMLNKEEIIFKYEGYGSFIMKGLKEEFIKELDRVM